MTGAGRATVVRAQFERHDPVPQEVIRPVELAMPEPAGGQALVEVVAAPINPSDLLTLTGEYGRLPELPAFGGNEGVGRVAQLGPGTSGPDVGGLVLLPIGCGSWSTHVVVDATALVTLPDDADPRQLAMMSVNPPTAALLLREFVPLQPGDWVLQNAANSAVGMYLVQLAGHHGYRTVNVVRRGDAVGPVVENGADVVLVDGEGLAERVAEATNRAGIRLGIDAVGGPATGRLADCLAPSATLVNYGRMSGEPCQVAPDAFVFRDLTMRGFWLARWFQQTAEDDRRALMTQIAQSIASGTLHAPIHATYNVSQISEAVAQAATGGRSGKVLVTP